MSRLIKACLTLAVSVFTFTAVSRAVFASGTLEPSLTLRYAGNNNDDPTDAWDSDVTLKVGQKVQLYAEIRNTVVDTTAKNVKIKATLPNGSGDSIAVASSENTNSVSEKVKLNLPANTSLKYVSGSTLVTWDVNGDGTREYDGKQVNDGIAGDGVVLGNQNGCNNCVIQLSFLAEAVEGGIVTPTPTPVVNPTPISSPVINISNNDGTNSANVSEDAGKTPDTGPSVAAVATLVGLGSLGAYMARYKKGQLIKEAVGENMSELVSTIVNLRSALKHKA